jgi:hypothetical protein
MKYFLIIFLFLFTNSVFAEDLYFYGGSFSRNYRKSDAFEFSKLNSSLKGQEQISSQKVSFIAGWRPDWDLSIISPEFRGLVIKHSLLSPSYYAEIIGIGPELRINAWGGINGYAGYNFNFVDDLIVFRNHFHFYDGNKRYSGYLKNIYWGYSFALESREKPTFGIKISYEINSYNLALDNGKTIRFPKNGDRFLTHNLVFDITFN